MTGMGIIHHGRRPRCPCPRQHEDRLGRYSMPSIALRFTPLTATQCSQWEGRNTAADSEASDKSSRDAPWRNDLHDD